jgi:ubiquinone/menaquinone biosynthesis C-methylase UbiE
MDTHKELLRTHFDSYARLWHQRMTNHVYAMRYRAVEQMVSHRPIGSVLDVGCGTGDYAQLFDPGRTSYLGIDISDRMIAECARLFPAHRFKVADGDSIEAANGSFDLVLSIGVLEYLTDPVSHLSELARVTKPGGNVIVAVPNGSNRSKRLDRPVRALLDSGPGRWLRRAAGRPVGQTNQSAEGIVKDASIRHRQMTVGELQAMGSEFGLNLVGYEHVSLYLLPELIPGVAVINSLVSRALSGRSYGKWTQRLTALVLVANFKKV